MGQNISLFPNYTQRENLATNYVMLVLRQIYQFSPLLLANFLNDFLAEGVADELGLVFEQQIKKGNSVPDGRLIQKPFAMYVETKVFDWFYSSQIDKHLKSLNEETEGKKVFLALSGKDINESKFADFSKLCETRYENQVLFYARTFQQFVDSLKKLSLNPSLLDLITEFDGFCRRENLLSNWRGWIDVVNASKTINKSFSEGAYFCPPENGAYKHDRCEFLGLYDSKCVSYIATFLGVVDITEEGAKTLVWCNPPIESSELIDRAYQKWLTYRQGKAVRVLLADKFVATSYKKSSFGGMQQHKRYLKLSELTGLLIEDVAKHLSEKTWS